MFSVRRCPVVETVPVPMPTPDADEPLDTAEDTRCYLCIDLKTFYASVECADRGLDPFTTNLVVADPSRGNTTICLAITPALKKLGIRNRCRVFEIPDEILATTIMARPRMRHYMEVSAKIYGTYLEYVSPSDIHPYSIDECFIDATPYLGRYGVEPRAFAEMLMARVRDRFSICATAGIGPNLFLAKVAMDIEAKHMQADKDGVRIAELDEITYRKKLWQHQPLTDFWRIGPGIASKLEKYGLDTMEKIASYALKSEGEDFLFKLFGVNAELIIDHAWGRETCTMQDIHTYEPSATSLGAGQVLFEPYEKERAAVIVKEMCDQLALDLTEKKLVTDSLMLSVGYQMGDDHSPDWYGRRMPSGVHGSVRLDRRTSSASLIRNSVVSLYEKIVSPLYMVRRISITACNTVDEKEEGLVHIHEQMDLFSDASGKEETYRKLDEQLQKEKNMQRAILQLRKKYGKNSVLKGTDYEEGATGKERNEQIGGHKA